METNPLYYGLSSHTKLEELDDNRLGIRKMIKTRIIQKDAAKIAAMANQLKSVTPGLEVTLICSSNICSKSLLLLEREGIEVQIID